jgi:hypothetical protein
MTDTTAKIRESREAIEKARDEVSALCNGKRWTMCIPAREGKDSDLIISAALHKADEALALLDAERPSVPMEPLRLLYNMAALNGGIPDNRDEIITAHMAEFGIDVKG